MRNIGIIEHISLDGVIQVPGKWSSREVSRMPGF